LKKNALIYVAGHSGLIGSAIVRQLKKNGYKNILTATHKELDLINVQKTQVFFKKNKIEYVFLCAGKVGGIYANYTYPADFIYQNLTIQTNIIELSYKYNVKKLLFLGCTCIYPKICPQPMKEKYLLSGYIEPTNEPYAVAKIAGIKMCQSYNRQHRTNFICCIGANIYGIGDKFTEEGHVVASLIKKFHIAKKAGKSKVVIWGTGKPRREFLYSDDFANACIFLMKKYKSNEIINVGVGYDTSIKEIAKIIKETVGFKGKIVYDKSKPDGIPKRLLDISKISAMGWKHKVELKDGIKMTYNWYRKKWE
jgi:GDP-L-fucose synthase